MPKKDRRVAGTLAPPLFRDLRGYALDPSLALQLETAPVSEVLFRVPWEPLKPGPVGEYLEVVDFDPAGRCFYEPVNLDDPYLLVQDGLPPSEGTPQFHQQMVYAVAQRTIHAFERALGRRAIWSPQRNPDNEKDDSLYVQRLRIYPHALREANAYYSPAKKALLFGYFQATDDDPGEHIPGGLVFACLSHDIVAHETAHALLDGLHRRLNRATNPDMLAFHEAFADIVALFQHFTIPAILRHQLANTRGDIRRQETLLGQLATQFGRSTGARGALRDAIGRRDPATGVWEQHRPDPAEYATTTEAHARGSILVAAVFDAFLSIYNGRIADLMRLYTGGTGVLAERAVHPGRLHRLADEAARTADSVLPICVQAFDCSPPVDLSFGECLRAVVTADVDLVPSDSRDCRIAFVEAFRRRGLYPRNLRTLSVENLRWRSAADEEDGHSKGLLRIIMRLRPHAHQQLYARTRERVFRAERLTRRKLHGWLEKHFKESPDGPDDAKFLGLDPALPFQVHTTHFATRAGPSGDLLLQAIIQLIQERSDLDPVWDADEEGTLCEGGCTLVADLRAPAISYCIRKPIGSKTRQERQLGFLRGLTGTGPRATYFGPPDPSRAREPFALLHRGVV